MRTTTTTGTPYARHKGTYAFMYRWTCYLYIPIYTRTYIGRGTSWYQPVIPVSAGTSPWQVEHIFITTKLHELKTALEASRGEWRCKYEASTDAARVEINCALVAFGINLNAYTHQHTRIHKERKNNFIKYAHAVGKRSGNFLTATCTQATIRYGDMSSLRSDVCLLIKNPV